MAVWPTQFRPLINSIQESPPDNSIRSQMDKGPSKIRRRTTANVRPMAFRLLIAKADVETFDDFYTTDTLSGADSFTFTHPRTGQSVEAVFVSPPSYQEKEGNHYEVSVSIEILP